MREKFRVPVVRRLMIAALLACCFSTGASLAQKGASPGGVELSHELHEALNLAQHGQPQQALEKVNVMLVAHPNYAPALKLKGMLLESVHRGDEANESYSQALKLDPNDEDLLYKVGVYQLVKGDRAETIRLLTHYLKLEPKDGDGYFYLAQAYHLTGQNNAALMAIKQCLQLKPDDADVWQKYGELLASSGDSGAGLKWLEKAKKADPSLARIDYDLGVTSLSAMNFEDAENYAERALALHEDAESLALVAAVEMKLAEWPEAKATFEKLIALNKDDEEAQLGVGHCEYELKNYQASIDFLKELLRKDPTVILAHYYLSRDYLALGDAAQAQYEADVHHKLMEATSFESTALGDAEERVTWEEAKKLIAAGKEDAAMELFKTQLKGVKSAPGKPYFMLGALLLYSGKNDDSEKYLRRALEIDPKVRGAHTYLGILDMQQDNLVDAEREFKVELANDANYLNALAELGAVRYRQQKWSEAAEDLVKSHTRTPALLLELCDAQFRIGDGKNAKLTAETIVAYAKSDQQVLDELSTLLRANHEDTLADRVAGTKK